MNVFLLLYELLPFVFTNFIPFVYMNFIPFGLMF